MMNYRHYKEPLYCIICSEFELPSRRIHMLNHRHTSSYYDRIKSDLDPFGQYNCRRCQRPLVISSSTLNGRRGDMFEGDYPGNPFHIIRPDLRSTHAHLNP